MSFSSIRQSRRGIVLVSTLISVTLIVGLVTMLQSVALSNTKTLKRLVLEETQRMDEQSVRELMRPSIAEAMIAFDVPAILALDGTPIELTFQDRSFFFSAVAETNGTVQPKEVQVNVMAGEAHGQNPF